MNLNALLQGGIVGAVVLWAAWVAFGKLAPRMRTRGLRALADWLEVSSRPHWAHQFATRLRPPPDAASGCASGCSSCDSCGSSSATTKTAEQPLQFMPRK
jgi:hypothetical protein